jgi:hypothetical protein
MGLVEFTFFWKYARCEPRMNVLNYTNNARLLVLISSVSDSRRCHDVDM